jgi:endonuclease G
VVLAHVPKHLTLGNPSGATADGNQPNNHLLSKHPYALVYNTSRGSATWVSWHTNSDWLGNAERCACFQPDTTLPTGFFQAQTWDYSGTGFDRGHLCPSADRDVNDADNEATFLLSNIGPQALQLNQGIWVELEDYARSLVYQGYEVYTIPGGRGSGGTGSFGGTTTTLAGGATTVPSHYWKVLLILPNDDADDIPNTQAASALPWGEYRTSMDAIEASTGLTLFSRIPATAQNDLEGGVDSGLTQ